MVFWIEPLLATLRRGHPATLVHIATVEGSAPREAGTVMLVGPDEMYGTIGGGELEHRALRQARGLALSGRPAVTTFSLGPDLDQCCGGRVMLVFEPFAAGDLPLLEEMRLRAQDIAPVWRRLTISPEGNLIRDYSQTEPPAGPPIENGVAIIHERLNPNRSSLYLFGAGHVGHATRKALAPLGFEITWVDDRLGLMADRSNGSCLELAIPESAVETAPPDAFYLVMTHSHDLDLKICEAVLRRGDFTYLGLIGSKSKRAHFLHRLEEARLDPAVIGRLVCPVGLPGIRSKQPAVIAASIAADLLLRREGGMSHAEE